MDRVCKNLVQLWIKSNKKREKKYFSDNNYNGFVKYQRNAKTAIVWFVLCDNAERMITLVAIRVVKKWL